MITGTSSEYLGLRPLRRLLVERPVIFIMGARGVGKTSVALRIAEHGLRSSAELVYVDTRELQEELVRCTRAAAWSDRLVETPSLVLDGPVFLQSRPGVVQQLRELLRVRRSAGRRTVVCEVQQDRSVPMLLDGMKAGSVVTVGLRYPASRSGRMRFARRHCDLLDLPRSEAQGTDTIEPWGYAAVIAELERRASRHHHGRQPSPEAPLRVSAASF